MCNIHMKHAQVHAWSRTVATKFANFIKITITLLLLNGTRLQW